nr:nuclear transport factor 2 family protein [uncultured Allomuricauda sp.]
MKAINNIITILAISMMSLLNAQMSQDSELYMTLKKKDSTLFDAAFNQCDVDTMESLFTEDFEFYHDKGGVTIGRDNFLAPNRENCAKIDKNKPQQAKRILVSGSLEVYPLYKKGELYGAIQHGIHSFEFLNEKKEYQKGDLAKFTHVWVLEDGHWKIKRELSYDHQLQK